MIILLIGAAFNDVTQAPWFALSRSQIHMSTWLSVALPRMPGPASAGREGPLDGSDEGEPRRDEVPARGVAAHAWVL
jgi:hypothetical protein